MRWRNWKAVRLKPGQPLELYDLSKDLGETQDVANRHARVVARIEAYLQNVRTESQYFPISKEN